MSKNSYKRLKAVLDHKEPDRAPFDIGATGVTGINIHALKKLRKYLGLPTGQEKLYDRISQLGAVEDDLIEMLGIDVKPVSPEPPAKAPLAKNVWREGNYFRLKDEFGIGWKMHVESGHWFDPVEHPLRDIELPEEVENYPWPNPKDPSRFKTMDEKVDRCIREDKKGYVLGRMNAGMWETLRWMTGAKKFFKDMIKNKKLIHSLMEKMTQIKIQYWEKALETVGKDVLVVSTADDLGSQDRLLVSKKLYKELIYPYHKRLFQFIHGKAKGKAYIFFHCDGAIKPIIPLLIDAGVDILNPVQVSAKGMNDTKELKREFGKDLTFWGAACNSQHVLSNKSPEEVKEEARRRIDDLAPGGGFVFAPIHNIQGEVPPENIEAMWKALHSFGSYK